MVLLALLVAGCGAPLADAGYRGDNPIVAGKVRISTSVENTVRCGSSAADDCRGLLLVAVIDQAAPIGVSTLLGSQTIPKADLSAGNQVSYIISGLPVDQPLFIAAFLSEAGASKYDPPYPENGDVFVAPRDRSTV